MIRHLIADKTDRKERSFIKCQEIVKLKHAGVFDHLQYGVRVEIVNEPKQIEVKGEHGTEVFVRAWKDGSPIGFGDGSIEIERFRIFNPPLLVDDSVGDIVKEWMNPVDGRLIQRKLREDPLQAIRDVIAHNIKLVGKGGTIPVKGKVGNTTDTFYPTLDGTINNSTGGSWAAARGQATGTVDTTSASDLHAQSESTGTDYPVRRASFLFDTSTIGSDSISSATFSVYSNPAAGNNTTETTNPANLAIVQCPATITSSDFAIAGWGSTRFATDVTLATYAGVSAYNDFALNASGISNINKAGTSRFGIRASNDIDNATPTARSYCFGYMSEQVGTANDPKLVVVHAFTTALPFRSLLGVGI